MNQNNNYKHIIWDWNGTLIDDAWLCADIMCELLSQHGLPLIDEPKYKEIFEFPISAFYKALGFKRTTYDAISKEFTETYNIKKNQLKLHNGAKNILQLLSNNNINHSILSASNQGILDESIDYFKLNNFFKNIIGVQNSFAAGKDVKGIKLINQLNVDIEKILIIGDTQYDYFLSKKLGCECLLVSHGHNAHSRLSNFGVPVFYSLLELYDYLNLS